ncbi:MAG: YjjG family noncanonical pyrimidine nucleotidase [Bacteroidetes bacterium]|nr:YjjG family noncanonical pyrimidine nucleotidase [Bacteroidota bacterium]
MSDTTSKYKHIFFDLDHTLWDFEANSRATLSELFEELGLKDRGIPSFETFHETYLPINSQYWARYHHKLMPKEELRVGRFLETLRRFKVDDEALAEQIADLYLRRSPYRTATFPDAMEVLEYLSKKYALHIITNGFSEVQDIKIRESRLEVYFRHVFVSEQVGHQKPQREIFLHAMEVTGATVEESLMIGDNMATDIMGAKAVGMDQVFFNPLGKKTRDKATYEIAALSELKNFL